ncbi:MAG: hypothetical protein BGO78_17825 [Chloroflexi bacterium 44-23]|nr:MAG: hypothetical protein BGO78_17825 [Chloroflexi bacterium 44-23]
MEKNKNHCEELITSISEYVDGSINPQLCLELEKHLSECDNCRVVVNTLKKTIDIYRQQSAREKMPSDVKNRLLARLHLEDYRE